MLPQPPNHEKRLGRMDRNQDGHDSANGREKKKKERKKERKKEEKKEERKEQNNKKTNAPMGCFGDQHIGSVELVQALQSRSEIDSIADNSKFEFVRRAGR